MKLSFIWEIYTVNKGNRQNHYTIMDSIIKGMFYYFNAFSGDYKYVKGDHIAYRYEMIDKLGHGSFGYVFKVIDHKYNQ